MKPTFKHQGEKWKRHFQQKNVQFKHTAALRKTVSVLLCHSLTHQLHIKATGWVFPYHFCGCQLPKNISWWRLEFISLTSRAVFSLTGHYLLVSVVLALSRNHFRPWENPLRNSKNKFGNYHLVKLILARLCHFRICSVMYFRSPWMQWNKLNPVTLAMQRHKERVYFYHSLWRELQAGLAAGQPGLWFTGTDSPPAAAQTDTGIPNPMARRGVMNKVDTGFSHFGRNSTSQPLQSVCQQFGTGPWHQCKNKPLEIQIILWFTQHSLCFSALK